MTATENQLKFQHKWLHVYFEQGRGKGGVPKVIIHVYDDDTPESIVAKSLSQLRAGSKFSHGQDLMPGEDDDYVLHMLEGAVLEVVENIRWVKREDGHQISHLVLTWGLPSEHLLKQTKGE